MDLRARLEEAMDLIEAIKDGHPGMISASKARALAFVAEIEKTED